MTVDLAALTDKATLVGTEQFILNDAGVAKDATAAVIRDYVASKGVAVGPYANVGALTTAYPVATSKGVVALVGTTAPYAEYSCDGSAWNVRGSGVSSGPLAQSAVPVVLPSSGSIANGLLSGLTALPVAYAGCWMYFPAGASLPSGAGLYWVVPSSTTAGQIYTAFQSTASAFTPYIPSNPVAVTSGGAAYTQTTAADITLANITVTGGLMGEDGALRLSFDTSAPNNANTKPQKIKFGGVDIATATGASNFGVSFFRMLRNRGSESKNVSPYVTQVGPGISSGGLNINLAIDTSVNQSLAFTGQLAVATDYVVLEGFTVEVPSDTAGSSPASPVDDGYSASVPDGATLNTTVIQAEIDALSAAGGGILNFRPGIHMTGPLTLKSNVTLTGVGATLKNTSYGTLITANNATGAAVKNITLYGNGDGTANYECGLKVTAGGIFVDRVVFDRFNDEALWIATGTIVCVVTNCYAGNSAMNYARASRTGVFRIEGTDHQFINNEIGSAQNFLPPATSPGNGWMSITSANLYNCGYYILAANSFFSMNRAQNLDVGFWIAASSNGMHRFSDNRGDCCWAHSFVNEAPNSAIVNHFAEDVSLQGTGLYSAVKTTGQNNRYSNCHGRATNRNYGPTYAITYPSYAFEDTVSAGEPYQKNVYSNCSGPYSVSLAKSEAWEGSAFVDPNFSYRVTTYGAINTNGTAFIVCAQAGAGTITDFTGDTNGKELTVLSQAGGSVTIQQGSRIQTKTGANISITWGNSARFIAYNGTWYQLQ